MFPHNLFIIRQIVLKHYTKHGSITVVLSAKFQNDLTTEMDVTDERIFVVFKFTMSFWGLSYIATGEFVEMRIVFAVALQQSTANPIYYISHSHRNVTSADEGLVPPQGPRPEGHVTMGPGPDKPGVIGSPGMPAEFRFRWTVWCVPWPPDDCLLV